MRGFGGCGVWGLGFCGMGRGSGRGEGLEFAGWRVCGLASWTRGWCGRRSWRWRGGEVGGGVQGEQGLGCSSSCGGLGFAGQGRGWASWGSRTPAPPRCPPAPCPPAPCPPPPPARFYTRRHRAPDRALALRPRPLPPCCPYPQAFFIELGAKKGEGSTDGDIVCELPSHLRQKVGRPATRPKAPAAPLARLGHHHTTLWPPTHSTTNNPQPGPRPPLHPPPPPTPPAPAVLQVVRYVLGPLLLRCHLLKDLAPEVQELLAAKMIPIELPTGGWVGGWAGGRARAWVLQ